MHKKKLSINEAYAIAYNIASVSGCHDKQVGCVLMEKDWFFLSAGCNISCGAQECLKEQGKTCMATHAEICALENLPSVPCSPYIAVCTLEPCLKCSQALWKAGVREIYYDCKTSAQKGGSNWFNNQSDCVAVQSPYNGLKNYAFNGLSSVIMTPLLADLLIGLAHAASEDKPEDKPEDEPEDKPEGMPDWATLFNGIRQYHKDLGYPMEFPHSLIMAPSQKQQLRDMVLALIDEAHEALHEADWKPWKRYDGQPKVKHNKFLEETGDILFFIDGMLMTFGLSWEDLAQAMTKKLKVTRDRMANGYHD